MTVVSGKNHSAIINVNVLLHFKYIFFIFYTGGGTGAKWIHVAEEDNADAATDSPWSLSK